MHLPQNRFKAALAARTPQIGLWANLANSTTVEILAGAGFDWLLIDTEHAPADLENVLRQLQAVAAYPTTPVVRVPWNDMVAIKRYLDIGVQSLMIPQVNSAEEAKNAVAFTRFPPGGMRGVAGSTRASGYGRVRNYHREAEREICVLVQAESRRAIEEIEAIAAVDGVDGIFIGPADLHASFGYLGERAHEKMLPVIDDAIVRIGKAGKAAGILTDNEQHARRWLDLGALFVAVGSDVGLLARGADALAARFKK
jgi:4-hydroxy-2-oxoheptanedioate aldolase